MSRFKAVLVFMAFCIVWSSAAARAGIVIENSLSPPFAIGTDLAATPAFTKAVGVDMPVGDDFTFDSFRAVLQQEGGAPREVTGHIRADDGANNPGAELQTLNTVTVTGGPTVYDFTSPAPFTLMDGQRYWFVLTGNGDAANHSDWLVNNPNTAPSNGVGNFFAYRFSTNGGASWSNSTTFNAVQINATRVQAIPEPGTVALLLIGAAGLAMAARRRLSKQ
jgi:hypothetical protein